MSSEVLQTDAHMAKLLETVGFGDDHLSMFWVFLAGLLDGSLVKVLLDQALSSMTKEGRSWNRSRQKLQLCRCYTESVLGRSGIPMASIGKFLKYQADFGSGYLSVSDCAAIGTVLQSHPQTERLPKINFDWCSMTDAGLAQLLPSLHHCNFIKFFHMVGNSLSQSAAAMSGVITDNASTLKMVSLGYNRLGDIGLEKLSESLKRCRKLQLDLRSNDLTSRSGATLSDVLPTLEWLWVSGNQLGDSGMEQLAHGLQFCTHLQLLVISDTALSSRSISVLSHLLQLLPALQLGVGSGDFSKDEMKRLRHGQERRVHVDLRWLV